MVASSETRLDIDLSIPTDHQLTMWQPGLVAFLHHSQSITIFEVVCAWELLILERQREKHDNYREIAADLITQKPGRSVEVVPMVVGSLGAIGCLR